MAGIRITLKETGQQSIARLWVAGVTSKIIKGYWVNSKGEKITLHPYDEPNSLYFYFESVDELINKQIILKVYDYTHKNAIVLYETKYTINAKWNTIKIPIRGDLFKYTENKKENLNKNILRLYSCLYLDGETLFRLNKDDYLKIHVVEYVTKVMLSQEYPWKHAVALQKEWFQGEASENPWENPVLGKIEMDWVLSFDRVKDVYDNLNKDLWKSNNAIKELKRMIQRMSTDSNIKNFKLPDKGKTVTFGVSDATFVSYENVKQPKIKDKEKTEKMPLFERFYYQSKSYEISIREPFDGLTGALGSFSFRVIAFGEITKNEQNYKIKISKIGIYIKDSFDFLKADKKENLGSWNIYRNSITYDLMYPSEEYYRIFNQTYRDYRDDYKKFSNKGKDFNLYSDIKYIDKNFTFYANFEEIE